MDAEIDRSKTSTQGSGESEQAGLDQVAQSETVSAFHEALFTFLLKRSKARGPVLWTLAVLAALVFLGAIPAAYFLWYELPPQLWGWTTKIWWHYPLGWFAFMFLFSIPIYMAIGGVKLTTFLLNISLSLEDVEIEKARTSVREAERATIKEVEEKDTVDLLRLLQNSRGDLDAYYTIGLKQTRRSFLHSVLAMWLGFILLLVGVALYVGPVEKIGLTKPDKDAFNVLVMGGAVIIEFISVLFLWAYRSSTVQLHKFYDRQMYSHAIVMCYRIASTITHADDAKKVIIEKVLDRDWTVQIPAPTGSEGLRKLLAPREAKTS